MSNNPPVGNGVGSRPITEDALNLVAAEAQNANSGFFLGSGMLRPHPHNNVPNPAAAYMNSFSSAAAAAAVAAAAANSVNPHSWLGAPLVAANPNLNPAMPSRQIPIPPFPIEPNVGNVFIGYFHDPCGNIWAASLQHSSHNPITQPNTNSIPTNIRSILDSLNSPWRPPAMRKRDAKDEIIDLQSEDEDDQDSKKEEDNNLHDENKSFSETNSEPSKKDDLASQSVSSHESQKETQGSQDDLTSQSLQESKLSPLESKETRKKDVLDAQSEQASLSIERATPSLTTLQPDVNTILQPEQVFMRPDQVTMHPALLHKSHFFKKKVSQNTDSVHEKAHSRVKRNVIIHSESQAESKLVNAPPYKQGDRSNPCLNTESLTLYGPFIQKFLHFKEKNDMGWASLTSLFDESELLDYKDKILMTATGYSSKTAPSSLPFPPVEINLDKDQWEELSHDFVVNKTKSVSDAVRMAYEECLTRHTTIVNKVKQNEEQARLYLQELDESTLRFQKEMAEQREAQNLEIKRLNTRKRDLEEQLRLVGQDAESAKARQKRTMETAMKASLINLRMMCKKSKQ